MADTVFLILTLFFATAALVASLYAASLERKRRTDWEDYSLELRNYLQQIDNVMTRHLARFDELDGEDGEDAESARERWNRKIDAGDGQAD